MSFVWTEWLYLLPAILLVIVLLMYTHRKQREAKLSHFASKKLLPVLMDAYSAKKQRFKNILLLLGITFICLALARPQWGYEWKQSQSKGIDVMFAIDCSRSMLAQDVKPNRLSRAKLAIQDFIQTLEGNRLGLIAFAGTAFLQCPLTLDTSAFLQSLDAISTDIISQGGTNIAAAIQEAQISFSQESNYKILVLITDGEDLEQEGINEAKKAGGQGTIIYPVGIGSAKGELIPIKSEKGGTEFLKDASGKVVKTVLDEKTLIKIAEATKGMYVPLGTKGEGLATLYEDFLQKIPKKELSSHMQKIEIDRFQWALLIAIFCLSLEILLNTRKFFRKK